MSEDDIVYVTDKEWEEFCTLMDKKDAPVNERLIKLLTEKAPWESDDESTE